MKPCHSPLDKEILLASLRGGKMVGGLHWYATKSCIMSTTFRGIPMEALNVEESSYKT